MSPAVDLRPEGRAGFAQWWKEYRLAILITFVAVCIYAPAIVWAIPPGRWPDKTYMWGSDEQVPVHGIQELLHTVTGSPGHDLHYPMFQYILLAIEYAPYLIFLKLSGSWPVGFREFSADSLRVLTITGRLLAVLMAGGTVFAAFCVGRTFGRVYGVLSAIFVGLMYPIFYYSRTGNLDGPALFWMAAGLAVYMRMVASGITLRRCAWLAVFAAASAGTKDAYYSAFVMMPAILVWVHVTSPNRKAAPPLWKSVMVLSAAGLAVYAVTSGFILSPGRYIAHIKFIAGMMPNSPTYYGQPRTVAGYIALAKEFLDALITSVGPAMLVGAAAGFLLMPRRLKLALFAPAATYVMLIIVPVRQAQIRFMLPVSLVAALFAAYACGRALEMPSPSWRKAGALAAVLSCLPLLAWDTEITYEMFHDSRDTLARWIDRRYAAGDPIGYFGPPGKLPRTATRVNFKLLLPWNGTVRNVHYRPEQVAEMVETVKATDVNTVILVQDNWEPENPYGTTCPTGLYERLRDGSLGFHLAEQLQTPPLMSWMARPRLDTPDPNPRVDVFLRNGATP